VPTEAGKRGGKTPKGKKQEKNKTPVKKGNTSGSQQKSQDEQTVDCAPVASGDGQDPHHNRPAEDLQLQEKLAQVSKKPKPKSQKKAVQSSEEDSDPFEHKKRPQRKMPVVKFNDERPERKFTAIRSPIYVPQETETEKMERDLRRIESRRRAMNPISVEEELQDTNSDYSDTGPDVPLLPPTTTISPVVNAEVQQLIQEIEMDAPTVDTPAPTQVRADNEPLPEAMSFDDAMSLLNREASWVAYPSEVQGADEDTMQTARTFALARLTVLSEQLTHPNTPATIITIRLLREFFEFAGGEFITRLTRNERARLYRTQMDHTWTQRMTQNVVQFARRLRPTPKDTTAESGFYLILDSFIVRGIEALVDRRVLDDSAWSNPNAADTRDDQTELVEARDICSYNWLVQGPLQTNKSTTCTQKIEQPSRTHGGNRYNRLLSLLLECHM